MAPGVVRGGAKLNELSENISFDSEFALAFEIQSFTVVSFVFFLNANFSKYSLAEWVNEESWKL